MEKHKFHSLCILTGYGHLQIMWISQVTWLTVPRFESPYRDTSEECIEFYTNIYEEASLKLIIRNQYFVEINILQEFATGGTWKRVYKMLPKGIHQVILEGRREMYTYGGIALDDITIKKCKHFGR